MSPEQECLSRGTCGDSFRWFYDDGVSNFDEFGGIPVVALRHYCAPWFGTCSTLHLLPTVVPSIGLGDCFVDRVNHGRSVVQSARFSCRVVAH